MQMLIAGIAVFLAVPELEFAKQQLNKTDVRS
jgi:hypothetical protein